MSEKRKIVEDHFDVEFERRLAELTDRPSIPLRDPLAEALIRANKSKPE